jgi:hypothetical protein
LGQTESKKRPVPLEKEKSEVHLPDNKMVGAYLRTSLKSSQTPKIKAAYHH